MSANPVDEWVEAHTALEVGQAALALPPLELAKHLVSSHNPVPVTYKVVEGITEAVVVEKKENQDEQRLQELMQLPCTLEVAREMQSLMERYIARLHSTLIHSRQTLYDTEHNVWLDRNDPSLEILVKHLNKQVQALEQTLFVVQCARDAASSKQAELLPRS